MRDDLATSTATHALDMRDDPTTSGREMRDNPATGERDTCHDLCCDLCDGRDAPVRLDHGDEESSAGALSEDVSAVGSILSAKKRWNQQRATVQPADDSADGLAMIKPAGTSSKNDQQAATVHPDTAAVKYNQPVEDA
ncbi:hypothetical protein F511_10691 [Dorcoceras hygrometricum]|uniref:Uncharacterized protein n=1 Tax=Dorcoceras hygrometricum TaxID=472368 RepID=A0A2Z7CG10_9LAMI|nr:hypothetical protein F511_10691 [Dorcoceras hygrometricum]